MTKRVVYEMFLMGRNY